MLRYVAFRRAINVGGHYVRTERLHELFVEFGYGGVETFIASGSVIFGDEGGDTDAMEQRIERRLAKVVMFASMCLLVLALHACGGEPAADVPTPPTPPALTQRQRAEAVGASRLPGAHGVGAALRAADTIDARTAAADTSGAP